MVKSVNRVGSVFWLLLPQIALKSTLFARFFTHSILRSFMARGREAMKLGPAPSIGALTSVKA